MRPTLVPGSIGAETIRQPVASRSCKTLLKHLDTDVLEVRVNATVGRLVVEESEIVALELVENGTQGVIDASNVAPATGGYAANRSLEAEYQPDHAAALIGCMAHATWGHLQLAEHGVPMTHTRDYD